MPSRRRPFLLALGLVLSLLAGCSGGDDAADRTPGDTITRDEADVLAELLRDVTPVEHRLFTGVITPSTFGKFGALLFRAMGGRFGDFRDWAEIERWSASIADALAELDSPECGQRLLELHQGFVEKTRLARGQRKRESID